MPHAGRRPNGSLGGGNARDHLLALGQFLDGLQAFLGGDAEGNEARAHALFGDPADRRRTAGTVVVDR